MLVKNHIAYGLTFSIILFAIFPTQVGLIGLLLVFLSSVLIDADHYFYTSIKDKHWNLRKSLKYFKKARKEKSKMSLKESKKYYAGWCFIHGIETIILLMILGKFVSTYFLYILMGVTFHLMLDWIEQIISGGRVDKISVIYDYFKYKKLKRI